MKFKAEIQFAKESSLWGHYIDVPDEIAANLIDGTYRRVRLHVNNCSMQCALMPKEGHYFINLGKPIRTSANLKLNTTYLFEVEKDDSVYGFDLPPEFEEILGMDSEFNTFFHAFTPGVQRSLIYLVLKIKNSEKRIQKTLAIAEHLRDTNGKLDYKGLNLKFKEYTHRFK